MLCNYGCGQEAKYKLKNNKWCCCKSPNSCIAVRNKNSDNHKKELLYKECPYCHKNIVSNIGGQYILHIRTCEYDIKNKKNNISFYDSKYQKWYNNIITNRIKNPLINGYKEKHHIIPKCCGGSNKKENLIYLTAKEHFICHSLLVEIFRNTKYYSKLLYAFMCMKRDINSNRYLNSRLYSKYCEEYSKDLSNKMKTKYNPMHNKIWVSNINLRQSIIIDKNELQLYIDNGWIKKRVLDFDSYIMKKEIKNKTKIKNKVIKQEIKFDKTKYYTELYKLYNELGWNRFKEQMNYKYTQPNLVVMFKKYVSEFEPQNGLKRG